MEDEQQKMQQRTSFRATVVGAFSSLSREMMQWCKEHLRRRKQARIGSENRLYRGSIDRCSTQAVHSGHAERPAVCTAAATTALTDLPANVINHIISLADKSSILPLFRTSKLLRDTVLGYVAVDGGTQLRTHLRIGTDLLPKGPQVQCGSPASEQVNAPVSIASLEDISIQSASRLLQLASQASHNVHLHVQASLPTGMTPQKMYWALSSSTLPRNTSDSSTRSIMAKYLATDWLSAMFKPCMPRQTAHYMQHVTSVWLQDIALDHPMPECIGCACPALKSYGLHNVVWPVKGIVIQRCWPHVQHVTLSDVYHRHLEMYFNPTTLPRCDYLHLAWSSAFAMAQWSLHRGSTEGLGACACTFQHQLTSFTLVGLPWFLVMPRREDAVFTRLTCLSITIPTVPDFPISYDYMLKYVVQSTPCLQQLHLNTLHLTEPCRLSWPMLHTLHIDEFESDLLPTLACLPDMPQLHLVTIPCGATSMSIEVGPNWVGDISRALKAQEASPHGSGYKKRLAAFIARLFKRLGQCVHKP